MKKQEEQIDSCPKCGYFLIKHSLIAECARCDYKNSKIKHNDNWAKKQGFKNYKSLLNN
jgi:ribosomal protein S27AE